MDWGLLERLCGDQPGFMQHLITLYIEDAQKDQDELTLAHAGGDLNQIERVAHRMCGAAKTMGALRIVLGCQSLHTAASAGDSARVGSEIAQIARELSSLFALLRARLGSLSPKR